MIKLPVLRKLDGVFRYAMLNTLSGTLPLYIVTEYPKSGASWLCQMLSEMLEVPFPRNEFPRVRSSIMHGHYLPTGNMKNVICVMRDGRDVIVSYYYHTLFDHKGGLNSRTVALERRKLGFKSYEDIRSNLPRFIRYKFDGGGYPRFTWKHFVEKWLATDATIVRYEDLLTQPVDELFKVANSLGIDPPEQSRLEEIVSKYSFKAQAGRDPGKENKHSFLRKGIAGDWRNNFNSEAKQAFDYYAGDCLIQLNYEKDHSWVQETG